MSLTYVTPTASCTVPETTPQWQPTTWEDYLADSDTLPQTKAEKVLAFCLQNSGK